MSTKGNDPFLPQNCGISFSPKQDISEDISAILVDI